jgi:hypothetical protein
MSGKDTVSEPAADSGLFPFRERKRKVDGTIEDYETELVYRDGRVAIVRFEVTKGGGPPRLAVAVPAGSVSFGYFWSRRPYSMYRWIGPDGSLLAHRFDAVGAVRIDPAGVDYQDLLLDWWVLPDGTLLEEDRDELEAAIASSAISAADAAKVNEAARQIYSRYRHIIDEVEDLERRHVRDRRFTGGKDGG